MKHIELGQANRSLAEYAREVSDESVVVTHNGKPLAAVVSVQGLDLESLLVANNPTFIEIVERSRASFKADGGIPLEEMKRRFSPTERSRVARKAPARPARRSTRKP